MPVLYVDTAEGIRLRTEIAGVGSRLAAGLLDVLLIGAGYIVITLLLWLTQVLLEQGGIDVLSGATSFVLGLLIGGLLLLVPMYFVVFLHFWSGQTPGKRMVGIRVVSAGGAPATIGAYVLRSLLWPIDALLFVPLPVGLLLIAVTPRCRRLGDLAAGTLVISDATTASYEEPWPEESWSAREGRALDLTPGMAAHLSEEDLALLRDAITRRDLPRAVRSRLYRKVVEHYARELGFTPAATETATLKELYLFGREMRRA